MLQAQRIKEINEAHEARKAKEQQALDAANKAYNEQLAKEFEESRVGQATKQFILAEEIYARAGEQLKNVQKNFFYDKNKALATQELERAAKQLEVMKAQKVKEENQVFYDRQVVVEREAHFAKIS